MSLFKWGKFTAASGRELDYKIMCENFTAEDWDCLARMVIRNMYPDKIMCAVGVPTGGEPFARAIDRLLPDMEQYHPQGKIIICEDVWTTGFSARKFLNSAKIIDKTYVEIWAVFARGPLHWPARALFMTEGARQQRVD